MPSPLLDRARPFLEAGLGVLPSLGGKPSHPDAWDASDGLLLRLGQASGVDAIAIRPIPGGYPPDGLRKRLGLLPSFRSPSGTEYALVRHRHRPYTVLHRQARYLGEGKLIPIPDVPSWDPFCPPTRQNLAALPPCRHPDPLLPFSLGEREGRRPSLAELVAWGIEVHHGELAKAWDTACVFNQGTMHQEALRKLFRSLTLKTYAKHG